METLNTYLCRVILYNLHIFLIFRSRSWIRTILLVWDIHIQNYIYITVKRIEYTHEWKYISKHGWREYYAYTVKNTWFWTIRNEERPVGLLIKWPVLFEDIQKTHDKFIQFLTFLNNPLKNTRQISELKFYCNKKCIIKKLEGFLLHFLK